MAEALEQNIPIFEMIQALRQELQACIEEGKGHPLRFELGEIDLELQVQVSKKKAGGLDFSIIKAGIDRSDITTHIFRLKLNPILDGDDGPIPVSDEVVELD